MSFSDTTFNLLTADTSTGKLRFLDTITKEEYPAKPEDSLLYEKNKGGDQYDLSKYSNELSVAGFNPVNPREVLKEGCSVCGTKVVSYLLVGKNKKRFYSCTCGHIWN
mgnify:CR=1 FL=1